MIFAAEKIKQEETLSAGDDGDRFPLQFLCSAYSLRK
jgi:hypothetical protein